MSRLKIKISFLLFTLLYFFSNSVIPALAAVNYSYDANGNMTSDGVNCYTYNDANQLSKVTKCSSGQTVAQYVYDYQGNRIVKKNYVGGSLNNTVYSPNKGYETKKLADNSTQNTTYYYVNDDLVAKKNPDGSKNYYHPDNLNSTSVLTDQSGNVVENTTYYPFGDIRTGGTKSKQLYTGQENDPETGLDYYNARYYNSHIRRFTQPDTEIADIYNPQNLNRYSYVNNNPLTYNDPTGHFDIPVIGNILDIGFAIFDAVSVIRDPGNATNRAALALDVAAAVVPGVPDGSGEILRVARIAEKSPETARLVEAVSKEVLHGNDLRSTAPAIGYTLRDLTTGLVAKFGETTKGVARYTQKYYREMNVRLQKEVRGTKAEMHSWQHEKIVEYKKLNNGNRPRLNRSDY